MLQLDLLDTSKQQLTCFRIVLSRLAVEIATVPAGAHSCGHLNIKKVSMVKVKKSCYPEHTGTSLAVISNHIETQNNFFIPVNLHVIGLPGGEKPNENTIFCRINMEAGNAEAGNEPLSLIDFHGTRCVDS